MGLRAGKIAHRVIGSVDADIDRRPTGRGPTLASTNQTGEEVHVTTLEKIYRRLGPPQKHIISQSSGTPRLGRITWKCGCGVDYIELHGAQISTTPAMKVTACGSIHRSDTTA